MYANSWWCTENITQVLSTEEKPWPSSFEEDETDEIWNAYAEVRDKLRHAIQAYHESYCGELQQMAMVLHLLSVENTSMINNFHSSTAPANMLLPTFALMLMLLAVEATASDQRVPYGL